MCYAVLGTLLLPLALAVVLVGGIFKRDWWLALPARFGFAPRVDGDHPVVVWCASVGEVNTAQRLIRELLRARPVVIATFTPSGLRRARELFGDAATVTLAPLDIMFCALRWIKRVRPRLVVLFETELWPLTLRIARDHGARLALVNGRMSDRSFPRYRRLRFFIEPLLAQFDLAAAQTDAFAERFISLGAPADRTVSLGSLKFDIVPPAGLDPTVEAFYRSFCGSRRVLVGGSTHPGEEKSLAQTLIRLRHDFPDAALIVAPRHVKRADEAERELLACGLKIARRSAAMHADPSRADVLLIDTLGELTWVYGLAHATFVGGSFTDAGGHNVLEPAAWGVPVIVGPRTPNFRLEVDALREAGALRVCQDENELAEILRELWSDDERRRQMGLAAIAAVKRHQGATERTVEAIRRLVEAEDNADEAPNPS